MQGMPPSLGHRPHPWQGAPKRSVDQCPNHPFVILQVSHSHLLYYHMPGSTSFLTLCLFLDCLLYRFLNLLICSSILWVSHFQLTFSLLSVFLSQPFFPNLSTIFFLFSLSDFPQHTHFSTQLFSYSVTILDKQDFFLSVVHLWCREKTPPSCPP